MRSFAAAGALMLVAIALVVPARADASPANVAALQAALRQLRLYDGHVDGIRGPLTRRAVIAFQRRRGLAADGVAGPRTRRALGWRGRPGLGSRTMRIGNRGWDVAALQYLLQRAGYGAGRADGLFGPLTQAAVMRAQRAAGIGVDGLAGAATIASLRGRGTPPSAPGPSGPGRSGPVSFYRPVPGPIGDGFGVSRGGGRVHQGLDFPVPHGTPVQAAGVGTTIFAGYNAGGYGNLVVVQHRLGYTTWYAHLSAITTSVGAAVEGGTRVGLVGSTGYSTGPHLHFEVRRYDTPIDPMPMMLAGTAARPFGHEHAHSHELECGPRRPASRKPARGGDWIAREPLCR
ncbi:MAG TPA: peptidoglycan-binding protein [Solirubrobacterales bacterium]|nr:peptidoglycan-binding protein [Solirubrobacterales bacterium]